MCFFRVFPKKKCVFLVAHFDMPFDVVRDDIQKSVKETVKLVQKRLERDDQRGVPVILYFDIWNIVTLCQIICIFIFCYYSFSLFFERLDIVRDHFFTSKESMC